MEENFISICELFKLSMLLLSILFGIDEASYFLESYNLDIFWSFSLLLEDARFIYLYVKIATLFVLLGFVSLEIFVVTSPISNLILF